MKSNSYHPNSQLYHNSPLELWINTSGQLTSSPRKNEHKIPINKNGSINLAAEAHSLSSDIMELSDIFIR